MYVCVCLGFNESAVQEAAPDAESIADVYRALGGQPSCGKCVAQVKDMVCRCKAAISEGCPPVAIS